MNMLLSCSIKKSVYTIIIMTDGVLKKKVTGKLLNEGNSYDNMLDVYAYAFELASAEIKLEDNVRLIIETSSSTLKKWLEQGCSRKEYFDKFIRLTKALNTIPASYDFIQNNKTMAHNYGYEITEDRVLNIDEVMSEIEVEETEVEEGMENMTLTDNYDYDNVTSVLDMFK